MRVVAGDVHALCPLYFELTYVPATGAWRSVGSGGATSIFPPGRCIGSQSTIRLGFEHVVPLDDCVLKLLRRRRRAAPVIGDGWIFPSPMDADRPISRHLVRDWWKDLERAAGIAHVSGRGWHGLRRRFATDVDHLPLKQLMKLGGWKTPASVIRYQRPTTEQLQESLKTRRNGARHRQATNRQSPSPNHKSERPGGAEAPDGASSFDEWAWVELNYRPHAYQACALTT